MAIASGTRLGPYDIQNTLGAGGMGEVYRARDSRLDRSVALKVLAPEIAEDPAARARFEREARAIASLDNPHICGIFDVGEASGTHYLVMPLLDGQTLAARLEKGPLPLDQALTIASQIADALDAAHRQGIVHRDLKPANVMLTKGGAGSASSPQAKLLDFGLAKLRGGTSPIGMSTMGAGVTTSAGTAQGTILGTLHYMAPEQVEGRDADPRSDIWSLGVVLYEMVTGMRPFAGGSAANVIGAILKDAPSRLLDHQPSAPTALQYLIDGCLAKDPDERWQSAGDLKRQLLWIASPASRTPVPVLPTAKTSGRSRALLPLLASGALIGMLTGWMARPILTPADSGRVPSSLVARVDLNLPQPAELSLIAAPSASLSPDGRKLAFTAQEAGFRRLYVRNLDESEARVFVATDASSQNYFSADSTAVVFVSSDRTIRRLSLADGLTEVLARGVDRNFGATWGRDGWVTYSADKALHQVPGEGGTPRQITHLDGSRGELFHAWPAAVPGSSAVLFTVVSGGTRDTHRIDTVDPRSGERQTVVDIGSYPMLARVGPLVFLRDNALVAAPFDRERMALSGPAVKVIDDVALDALGAPLASLSESGSLVYISSAAAAGQLVSVTRAGLATPISDVQRPFDYPRVAPDGSRIVASVAGDLWQVDTRRSTFTRVTAEAAVGNSYAVWTPDGRRVIFRTATGLRISAADGGQPEPIKGTDVTDFPNAVTKDGKLLVFTRQTADAAGEIYVLSLQGEPGPHPLFSTPAYEGGAVLSPDDRWVAYASNESGRYEVQIRPFPDASRKHAVSSNGGTQPMWSRTGGELFYRNGSRMMSVKVGSGAELNPGQPEELFDQRFSFGTGVTFAQYDVRPDGRFVMISRGAGQRLSMVLNWTEELRRLTSSR